MSKVWYRVDAKWSIFGEALQKMRNQINMDVVGRTNINDDTPLGFVSNITEEEEAVLSKAHRAAVCSYGTPLYVSFNAHTAEFEVTMEEPYEYFDVYGRKRRRKKGVDQSSSLL